MSTTNTVNRAGRPASSRLIRVVAISLTVTAFGYGIAETGANFLNAPEGANLPVTTAGSAATAEAQPVAVDVPVVIGELTPAFAEDDGIENPRACDLDEGITEACIFD